jgi:hypothetical protein
VAWANCVQPPAIIIFLQIIPHTDKNDFWETIPTQLDTYPDIAECKNLDSPVLAGYFSEFLTDDTIIKSRKSYIVGHFLTIPTGPDFYPAQVGYLSVGWISDPIGFFADTWWDKSETK